MRRHAETLSPGQFYLDRFLRIYPHFLLFYVLSFVAIYMLLGSPVQWLALTPNWPAIVANLLMLPMAFNNPQLFGEPGQWVNSALLVPQAWSLGIEASYYLVLPLIARTPRLRDALFWVSLGIFVISALNVVSPGYGYRCLPGTLWMFLLGWRLHDLRAATIRWLGIFGLGIMGLMFIPLFRQSPTIEVASGSLVASWVIIRLAKAPADRRDTSLGAMSYSLFLCHFIPIFAGLRYPLIVVTSLGLAYGGARLEMCIADIRRRIRSRRNLPHAHEAVEGAVV